MIQEGGQIRTRLPIGSEVLEDIWFPLDGIYPTWRWLPGHRVPDSIRFKVPPEVTADMATVEIGWFRIGMGGSEGDDWYPVGTVKLRNRMSNPEAAPAAGP